MPIFLSGRTKHIKNIAVTKLSVQNHIVSMSVTSCISEMGPKQTIFVISELDIYNVHFQNFLESLFQKF